VERGGSAGKGAARARVMGGKRESGNKRKDPPANKEYGNGKMIGSRCGPVRGRRVLPTSMKQEDKHNNEEKFKENTDEEAKIQLNLVKLRGGIISVMSR